MEQFDKLEAAGMDFAVAKPIIPSVLYNGILEIFKSNVLEIHDNTTLTEKAKQFTVNNPYHVLICEDNITNQFIAKSLLEQAGFLVTVANNGKEGFDYFAKNISRIDIILMDLHMPIMNGFDASRLIREIDEKIPIILMTADAITGVEEKCKGAGISNFITKPFEPEVFAEYVWRVLREQREADNDVIPELEDSLNVLEEIANKDAEAVLEVEKGIKQIGGNQEIYNNIIGEYYKENMGVQASLSKAIEDKNFMVAVQIVHKIKSSSGSIGAKRLYDVACRLQKALADEEKEEYEQLFTEFSKLLNTVLKEIEKIINWPLKSNLEKNKICLMLNGRAVKMPIEKRAL